MAETNPFGTPDAGSGGDAPQQPWDFGGASGESGRTAKGIGAVKKAVGGALGKTGERIGGVASSIGHAASHIHRPDIPRPDIHMPHIPRPDLTGAKNAVGGGLGRAGERIGHVAEVFRTAHVREAISHAVTGVTGRIPRPEFVAEVARRSARVLSEHHFLGQSLGDLATGMVIGGGAKAAARMALGISGVGTIQLAALGFVGGAASTGFREYMSQRRGYVESADTGLRAQISNKLRVSNSGRLAARIITGGAFGAAGAVVGGEIAEAILDRIGVAEVSGPEVGMPSMPNIELPNIQGPNLSGVGEALGGAKDAVGGAVGGGLGTVGETARNVPGLGGAQDLLGNAGKTVGDTLGGAGKAIGDIWQERFGSAPAQPDLDKMQAMQAIDDQQQMLDAAEARERAQQLAEEARRVAPVQPDLDKIQAMQAIDDQQQMLDAAEARERAQQLAEEARKAAQPQPIPPTDVHGHTMAGSVIDKTLTWDGKPWVLLENGVKNIGHVFEAVGQTADSALINQELLAQKLQEAAILQAQGQLTYSAHSDLYDLFHLSNGTASEYPGLLNKDTLDVLRNLRIIAK